MSFIDVCNLILERLEHLLGDSLLLLKLALAGKGLSLPEVKFLAHAVNVVGHEVDALAKRIRRLAEDLDGFLHKLDVIFAESCA